MPIAFSNSTIVRSTVGPCASVGSLISALHTVFTSAGWPSVTYLTTGHEYTLTSPSPQSLSAKLRLYDPSDAGGWVVIQLLDPTATRIGQAHKLNSSAVSFESPSLTYDVWANICQFAIGKTGSCNPTDVAGGHAVAGGVPFSLGQIWTGDCTSTPPPGTVSELWWSCGDTERNTNQSDGRSFRQGYLCPAWFDACYNNVLRSYGTASHNTASDLQLLPLRPANNATGIVRDSTLSGLIQYHPPSGVSTFPDYPLTVEPILLWGLGTSDEMAMRAQLYDALLPSRSYLADEKVVTLEYDAATAQYYYANWHNYMRSVNRFGVRDTGDLVSYFTSLLLLDGTHQIARRKTYAH